MKPRTAIVTGASRRVGAVIAAALIEDGWSVIGHVHDDADTVPPGCIKVVADLAERDCAKRVFAPPAGNHVALLVNNAARFAPDAFGAFSPDELDSHMAINLRAPMLLAEAFTAQHAAGDDGLIVSISDAKLAAPNPDYLSYTLSKGALEQWSDLAARRWGELGIRVNCIAPSLMLQSPGQDAANFAAMHAANPLRRGTTPDDVVAALRFLIAAPTMTGATLTLDGGQRFWRLPRDVQFLSPGGDGSPTEK